MRASFDVVVVGAGPGGIAAAVVASEAGRSVCLLDDNPAPGGQIWRGLDPQSPGTYPHGKSFDEWSSRLRQSSCEIWQGWQAVYGSAVNASGGVLRLERNGEGREIGYSRLILATGARERFLPFPGWTLPGVFGAGGLQALIKSGLKADSGSSPMRAVVAGSGPLLLAVAAGLRKSGVRVESILEQASLARLAGFGVSLLGSPGKLAEGARYRLATWKTAYRTGAWVLRADGQGRVELVTATDGRKRWKIACDWLACGFHLVPNLELPRLLGCRISGGYVAVDSMQQSSVERIACVGEPTGIGGLEKALIEGEIAGWAAAGREAEARELLPQRQRHCGFAARLDRGFALRAELRELAEADTLVCRCEDVKYAALESCSSWREAKLHTRCGMGACQGRVCGAAAEFLFGWETAGVRPPVFPAAVSTLAGDEVATPARD
jgi:NADPH-dependent 2,4-dienoyl-CoA reductase/sulfur reductase-like enzyme